MPSQNNISYNPYFINVSAYWFITVVIVIAYTLFTAGYKSYAFLTVFTAGLIHTFP